MNQDRGLPITEVVEKLDASQEAASPNQVTLVDEPGFLFEYHFTGDPEKLKQVYAVVFEKVLEIYGLDD